MKEAINVNIGQQAFVMDKDACERLSAYLADVRARLGVDTDETMNDIETRFAEIFNEMRPSPAFVVTLDMVGRAIRRMGSPEEFGPAQSERQEQCKSHILKGIRRSRKNRSIAGVCGGLAEAFGFNATVLRLGTLMLMLCGGLSVWVYIILWIVIPEADK